MDVLRAEAQRQVRSIDAEMASVSGVERPLFTAGHVEMVLTQRLKSARGMGSGESEYFTQDKILRYALSAISVAARGSHCWNRGRSTEQLLLMFA